MISRQLDDDFRRELLDRCRETDEGIRKIGLAFYCTFLRADLRALVETLRDRHPVSITEAKSIAREYLTSVRARQESA